MKTLERARADLARKQQRQRNLTKKKLEADEYAVKECEAALMEAENNEYVNEIREWGLTVEELQELRRSLQNRISCRDNPRKGGKRKEMINLKVLKNKKSMNKHMVKKRIKASLYQRSVYLEQLLPCAGPVIPVLAGNRRDDQYREALRMGNGASRQPLQ